MVAVKSLIALLAFGGEVVALKSSVICQINLALKAVHPIPTKSATSTKKVTLTKQVIKRVAKTIIPVAKASTIPATSYVTVTLTADPNTVTFVSGSRYRYTVTDTASTSSVTITITTNFVTSTVTAPAGFTAVLDDPLYVAKRDLEERHRSKPKLQPLPGNGRPAAGCPKAPKLYPHDVRCVKEVTSVLTKTVTKTSEYTTTLSPVTKTTTVTTTLTTSTVEYPADATSTVLTTVFPTTTSIYHITTTTTDIQTSTVDIQVAQATVYDACAANNILLTANGGGRVIAFTSSTSITDNVPTILANDYTPATCCAECASRPNCRISKLGAIYNLDYTTATMCSIYLTTDTAQCDNGQQPAWASYITSTNAPTDPLYIFSNGPCGQLQNGGDISGF